MASKLIGVRSGAVLLGERVATGVSQWWFAMHPALGPRGEPQPIVGRIGLGAEH